MRSPADYAREVEERPSLPPGPGERVSGYGVMGLHFASGHVLGLRRWTASSVGEGFTSIWHRDPAGHWSFHESVSADLGCSRYFGAGVDRARVVPIDIEWEGPFRLRVSTEDALVDWTVQLATSPVTRAMSAVGAALPIGAWRSPPVLKAMGRLAGWALGAGTVQLSGTTSNGQHFDANPRRVWRVTESTARVEGVDLGPVGAPAEQARLADFFFPRRGIFAVGRVFVTPEGANGSEQPHGRPGSRVSGGLASPCEPPGSECSLMDHLVAGTRGR